MIDVLLLKLIFVLWLGLVVAGTCTLLYDFLWMVWVKGEDNPLTFAKLNASLKIPEVFHDLQDGAFDTSIVQLLAVIGGGGMVVLLVAAMLACAGILTATLVTLGILLGARHYYHSKKTE